MRPNLDLLRSALGPMLTETGSVKRAQETVDEDGMSVIELVTIHAGPVLVRPEGGIQYVDVGGVERPVIRYDVTFPAETPVVVGDVLVLDYVPQEPGLTGAHIKITDAPLDAWAVARFCKGERQPTA